MRIGIEASSLFFPETGTGAYTFNLLEAMTRLAPNHRFVLFLNSLRRPAPDFDFMRRPNVEVSRWRFPGPWLIGAWRRFNAPAIDRLIGEVDALHSPGSYVPPLKSGRRVATIQDLYVAKKPEHCDSLGGKYLAATLPDRIPQLDRIITPSEASRRDVIDLFGAAPEQVRTIPHGVDHERFRPIDDERQLAKAKEKYRLPEDFILTVAVLEPRKNLEGLIAAYRQLKDSFGEAPKLVIAGSKGWKCESVFAEVERQGLRQGDNLQFLGNVPAADLPEIYNSASLFALPSFDEGFGLPVIEAMACGLPVVTSDAPALCEVGGEAALRVAPDDHAGLAEAMHKILCDPDLSGRLRQASLRRAQDFSWDRCAEGTLETLL